MVEAGHWEKTSGGGNALGEDQRWKKGTERRGKDQATNVFGMGKHRAFYCTTITPLFKKDQGISSETFYKCHPSPVDREPAARGPGFRVLSAAAMLRLKSFVRSPDLAKE